MILQRLDIKVSLLFLCIFAFCSGKSQVFGTRTRSQLYGVYSTALSQPHDGFLRTFCLGADSGCCSKCKVFVFNQNLALIDSVSILTGFRPDNNEPIRVNDRLYWATIRQKDTTTLQPNKTQIFSILELDTIYHHINNHDFDSLNTTNVTATTLGMAKINNSFYAAYWLRNLHQTIVYKLNNQFVKIDSMIYNALFNDMKAFEEQLLVSFRVDTYSTCVSANQYFSTPFMKAVIFDTLFNQVSCRIFDSLGMYKPGNVSNYMGLINDAPFFTAKAIPITNSKYLALGARGVSFSFTDSLNPDVVYNFIMDKNHNKLNTKIIGNANANTDYFDFSNYAAVQSNEILTVGTIGYDFQKLGPVQLQSTKIFVNKTDTSGNTIWYKEYSDGWFYRTNSIVFTTDGGCLISGIRSDSATMKSPFNWENFLLKLDANGNYNAVGIFDRGRFSNSIKSFPNPAANKLKFDIPLQENISIEIYNCLGLVVIRTENYTGGENIDISGLKNDIYFYRITTKSNFYTGKISVMR